MRSYTTVRLAMNPALQQVWDKIWGERTAISSRRHAKRTERHKCTNCPGIKAQITIIASAHSSLSLRETTANNHRLTATVTWFHQWQSWLMNPDCSSLVAQSTCDDTILRKPGSMKGGKPEEEGKRWERSDEPLAWHAGLRLRVRSPTTLLIRLSQSTCSPRGRRLQTRAADN